MHFSYLAFGFVPFLNDILSRTVPTLNNVKADQLKLAFTIGKLSAFRFLSVLKPCTFVAIKRYAESLCHYVDNIDQAPDPNVKKEIYSTQFGAVYDVLFSQWLQIRDQKV